MGGGPKIPYPKQVWSPAGGWYSNPANWKQNTLVIGSVMFGVVALIWRASAEREDWARRPEPERFAPSRYWSRQLRDWDREAESKKNNSS